MKLKSFQLTCSRSEEGRYNQGVAQEHIFQAFRLGFFILWPLGLPLLDATGKKNKDWSINYQTNVKSQVNTFLLIYYYNYYIF